MDIVSGAVVAGGAGAEAAVSFVGGFGMVAAAAVTMNGDVTGTGHDLTTVMSKGKHFPDVCIYIRIILCSVSLLILDSRTESFVRL